MKKVLMMGVGGLALVGINIGVSYVVLKPGAAPEPQPAAAQPAEPLETFYVPLRPEFVVNFQEGNDAEYLMVEVTVGTTDSKVPAVLETHMPALRNDLVQLFGRSANNSLYEEAGVRALRDSTREAVEQVVEQHYGKSSITDIYFTRFVMQ